MRFRHLDFLRFSFAMYIVAWHSFGVRLALITNAALAVDLFFILSGFVLTQMIIKQNPSYLSFAVKRFARLWPLHIVTASAAISIVPKFQ